MNVAPLIFGVAGLMIFGGIVVAIKNRHQINGYRDEFGGDAGSMSIVDGGSSSDCGDAGGCD